MKISKFLEMNDRQLIEWAVKKIKDDGAPDGFPDRYTIRNVLRSKNNISVSFDLPERFIPKNTSFKGKITAYAWDNEVMTGTELLTNPKDMGGKIKARDYVNDEKAAQVLLFVKNSLKKAKKGIPNNFNVYEADDHYEISERTDSMEWHCKIDKKTGALFDEWHAHLEPRPNIIE